MTSQSTLGQQPEQPQPQRSAAPLLIGKLLAFGFCLSVSLTDVVFKVSSLKCHMQKTHNYSKGKVSM